MDKKTSTGASKNCKSHGFDTSIAVIRSSRWSWWMIVASLALFGFWLWDLDIGSMFRPVRSNRGVVLFQGVLSFGVGIEVQAHSLRSPCQAIQSERANGRGEVFRKRAEGRSAGA